jgi:uncharacterized protein YbcI
MKCFYIIMCVKIPTKNAYSITKMASSDPTQGQVERLLLQKIQNFYRERIGQRPTTAICQLFDEKVTVVLGKTISCAEQTLLDAGQSKLAKRWRWELHEALKPRLKILIEETLDTPVITVLVDSDMMSGFSSITAVLGDTPSVRNPEKIPKVDLKKLNNSVPENSEF